MSNPAFNDQSLAKAYDACMEIYCKYAARSNEGKLGSIKQNRNGWKRDAASECCDAILAADKAIAQAVL